MIVLDTTVLVYAKGRDHPFRGPCRELIGRIAAREIEATTTAEVVQEFAHVRARRRTRAEAAELARDYVELLTPLLALDRVVLENGLSIFGSGQRLGAFDAVLAAAALEAGASHLVSADEAFGEIEGLRWVKPDARGLGSL